MIVSPLTNSSGTSQGSGIVDTLKQLKAELANQLKKVDESSEDAKTKAEKKKQLTEQITMVDAQIQQAIASDRQKKMQEAIAKAPEKAAEEQADRDKEAGVVVSASLNKVLSLQGNMAEYRSLGKVRTRLKGEVGVAQSQVDNNFLGGSVKYQLDVIASNTSRLAKLESEMGKTAGEIREGVAESVKAGSKEAEKTRENKDGKTVRDQEKTGETTTGEAVAAGNPAAGTALPADANAKRDQERRQPESIDVVV